MKSKLLVINTILFYSCFLTSILCKEKTCIESVNTIIGMEDGGGATYVGVCAPHGFSLHHKQINRMDGEMFHSKNQFRNYY